MAFAGDCKSELRLSESYLIISSFLVFSAGLDLGSVCHLVVMFNISSGELNVGAWMKLLLCFFAFRISDQRLFAW